jgi:hypothetical protein
MQRLQPHGEGPSARRNPRPHATKETEMTKAYAAGMKGTLIVEGKIR